MQGLETATGAQIDIERKVRYPSVRNPRELVEQFYAVLDSMDDAVLVEPVMAAEDFRRIPAGDPGGVLPRRAGAVRHRPTAQQPF